MLGRVEIRPNQPGRQVPHVRPKEPRQGPVPTRPSAAADVNLDGRLDSGLRRLPMSSGPPAGTSSEVDDLLSMCQSSEWSKDCEISCPGGINFGATLGRADRGVSRSGPAGGETSRAGPIGCRSSPGAGGTTW